MKLSTYYTMQVSLMALVALIGIIGFVALRESPGALGILWIYAGVIFVGEIFETLFFSKHRRFEK